MTRSAKLEDPNLFGMMIRERRQNLKLSQAALGKLIGCTGIYISMLERGAKTVPNAISLIKLSIALRLDFVDFLLSGKLIESCDNRDQINKSARFIEIWELSLDLKEATRISRLHLESALARSSESSPEVKALLRIALKNVDFIFDFCFDARRIPITKGMHIRNKIIDV